MMTSPISPSMQSVQYDKRYYIHSADLVFLVENILFRVHRYFFERESVHFQTLLATPSPENEPEPGSSDSSAIMLDTTASRFSRFVWVFYNPKYSLYDEATLDDWKSILELSHRWLFPEIKQLAIRELQKQPLSPVQRIQLYHTNSVDRKILVPDYIALCQRPSPLTLHEGLDLGLETTLMIARTREEIRTPRSPDGVMTPLTPTLQGPELLGLIGTLFVSPESDSSNDVSTTVIGQPMTPTIATNGVQEPKVGEKTPMTAIGTNGVSNPISGGSTPSKPNKQTEQAHKQNQSKGSKQKNQSTGKKNQQENQDKSKTTRQTGDPKNKETVNEEDQRKQNKEGDTTPVAGQQGAGAGAGGSNRETNGGANGTDNQENGKDDSTKGVTAGAQAGPKVEGTQGGEGGGTGDLLASNGDTGQTNGGVDKDKTDTQANSSQQGTVVNGVGNGDGTSLSIRTNA